MVITSRNEGVLKQCLFSNFLIFFFFSFCVLALRFGFVDFDTEENCKAGKDAFEDCEIDGNKVCVAYARCKGVKPPPGTKKSPLTPSAGKPASQKPKKGGAKGNFDGLRVEMSLCFASVDIISMSFCSLLFKLLKKSFFSR